MCSALNPSNDRLGTPLSGTVRSSVRQLPHELDVSDLRQSLAFYVCMLDFSVRFDRPEEGFAYLDLDGIPLMLETATGPGRRFHSAPLEHPDGRGVNFQIEVVNVDDLVCPRDEGRIDPAHCPGGTVVPAGGSRGSG